MLTIKEKLYFKFRSKLERDLYVIIKIADKVVGAGISLDTLLYEFPTKDDEDKILKIAVDAYFYTLFFDFDAIKTANAKNMEAGLDNMYVENTITVAEYISRLAKVIAAKGDYTGMPISENNGDVGCLWVYMQDNAKKVLFNLQRVYNLKSCDMYAYGFPGYSHEELYEIRKEIMDWLISPYDIGWRFYPKNWASLIAVLCKKALQDSVSFFKY